MSNLDPSTNISASHGMDPEQVWATLRQNWKTIGWIGGGFLVITSMLTMFARMDFKSTGRLYLGDLETKARLSRTSAELELSPSDQGDLGSEIEIIRSDSLVSRAVLSSGLNAQITTPTWKPPRFWRWLVAGRDRQILDVGVRKVSVVEAKLSDDSRGAQDFQVRFVSPSRFELWRGDTRLGQAALGEYRQFQGIGLKVVRTGGGEPDAHAVLNLRVFPLDDVVRAAGKTLLVSYPKATAQGESVRVLFLEFSDKSPHLAAAFLRSLMSMYLAERHSWKTEEASAAESFVSGQLSSLREGLDSTEKRLAEYRSENRGVVLDNEAKALIEQVGKYEEQRVGARLQVAALADMKRILRQPDARAEAFMLGEADDPVLEDLAKNLTEARQRLASIQERFSEDAPDVREQRAQVETQLETIRNYITNRLGRAQENLSTFNNIIGQFETKLKTVPGAELGLVQLSRESEVYSKMYSFLLERQQQAAISKASTVSRNRILDAPRIPYREDSPTLAVRIPASLMGFLVGALLVLARHLFSSRLQSELAVRSVIGPHPILATLPRRREATGPSTVAALLREVGNLARYPSAPFTESLRTLRARLYQSKHGDAGQVLLFTSPTPGDGKTTTALSMALMLAADHKTVLLIDADLRKPSHHELLGTRIAPGLTTVLNRGSAMQHAVNPVSFPSGEFISISAGEPDAVELFSSTAFSDLVEKAKARFDFVLIDSASFPLVSDALLLSPSADMVISVLRLHHTRRVLAAEHLRGLEKASSAIGVVVNGGPEGGVYGTPMSYGDKGRVAAMEGAAQLVFGGKHKQERLHG